MTLKPNLCLLGTLLSLLLTNAGVAENARLPRLPAEVTMNDEAGRGGVLIVTLRLAGGEDLPFLVDTGTSDTFCDRSLEPKLGKLIGTGLIQSWGVVVTNNVYTAPKLYLGDIPLLTGDNIITMDCQRRFGSSGHPVMGILGWDTLCHYCLQLDFAARKVRFLDDQSADKKAWGRAFPIVALNAKDPRPAVAGNLFGAPAPHSLIDTGCNFDGWLMPQWFQQWTNHARLPVAGEARSPNGMFAGEAYPDVDVARENVESDGLGILFLSRHLVTLDFPQHTLYLQRQSTGPLTGQEQIQLKTTPLVELNPLIHAVLAADVDAARLELDKIRQSHQPMMVKVVAQKLEATIENDLKPVPSVMPSGLGRLSLGDAYPEVAEVGWLKPTSNRIPLNDQIESPLLDSGKIYATGLYAHAPSRYVFDLGGQWNHLRGEAGLHTAFQPYAFGVVFVIKTDGREAFRSPIVRGEKHVSYNLDLTGVNKLELVVEKATDQNGGDWGLWLDPILTR